MRAPRLASRPLRGLRAAVPPLRTRLPGPAGRPEITPPRGCDLAIVTPAPGCSGAGAGDSGDRCLVGVQRVVILEEAGVVTVAEGLGAGELDSDRLADERGH